MRKKEQRTVVAFPSITDALATQAACEKRNLEGRLIPLPPQISASCGIAWSCDPSLKEAVLSLLVSEDIHFSAAQTVEFFC